MLATKLGLARSDQEILRLGYIGTLKGILTRSLDASHCGMTTLFPCAEFQHLRREYETALRVWGQYEFPLPNAPLGLPEQPYLKQKALDARNAAKERLNDQRENCRICKIEQRLNEWPRRHRPKAG